MNKTLQLEFYISKHSGFGLQSIGVSKVGHTDWKEIEVNFIPESDAYYIYVIAKHIPNPKGFYGGNILIDNISNILEIKKE